MLTSVKQAAAVRDQQRYVKAEKVAENTIDGEIVMAHFLADKYFGLNRVGSRIWQLLATPCTINQLCSTLIQEFEVETPQCNQEVSNFIQVLLTAKLVRQVEG